ncbi:MAG TPA: acyl-CoA dehydrogenase family protein [Acidimicrobiales bacterium]|nr:acyl-CoA dehydrogenase family protein [Acidimicrobiales bacterium]
MELELTEDQEFFLATTRRFLAAEAPVAWVRTLEDDPAGFTPEYWRAGAALGWTSLLVPEADGGGSVSGNGLADLVLVAEEMGRLASPGPLVPVNVVAAAVSAGGSRDHKDAVLPGLLDGSAVAAWTGPGAVEAEATAGGHRLTGVASPVEAGAQADHLLVSARGPDGPFLLLVDPQDPDVTVTPLGGLDLVRRHAEVRFDGVAVPRSAAVDADPEHLARLACAIGCAESVGVMDRVFEMTLEWLADRWSFGRPLASYQALKHRVADDRTALEACHAIAAAAARAVAAGTPDAADLVSAAKAWIGRQSTELVQDCIQFHGGIGVTWEHDLHVYLRRATVNRLTYGTPEEHADRLAAGLLEEAS